MNCVTLVGEEAGIAELAETAVTVMMEIPETIRDDKAEPLDR